MSGSQPGAILRAEAARALTRIAFDGASLRSVFEARAARLADPRDRALFSALLHAGTRWWLRHEAALALLMERALPPQAREVRALLVLGFVQVDVLGMPDYAVVAACVDATRVLGQPRHAGLVNAVLRRFVREREALLARLDADPVTRHAHPRWLIEQLGVDWPGQVDDILAANNRQAPLVLRVNRRRGDRAELAHQLAAAGVTCHLPDGLEDAIALAESTDVSRLPGYAGGVFSVQDGAAQRVVELLELGDGQRVLDACAAPGGKSAHMLERARVALTAIDSDAARLPRMRENLSRLGLSADVRQGDAAQPADWWDGRPFERILVDAPCSATGIIRRQPDIKLHRRASDIAALAATQGRLLASLWPMLVPGGRLVYATCSVLRAENEVILDRFVGAHADASIGAVPSSFGASAGGGRQNLPGSAERDGFYYACVDKATR